MRALLVIAQVVGSRADASNINMAANQLSGLVDQITAFENRIGLGMAQSAQITQALEDYEMLTEEELGQWGNLIKLRFYARALQDHQEFVGN